MKILAIDTSGDRTAIGLAAGEGPVLRAEPAATRRHGRDLVPAIRDLLRSASLQVSDLEVIGVGLGPGSYTGLRIGLTAARVLAYASGASLVGFDSLEAVAGKAPPDALEVAAVADAQRGDVYAAALHRSAPGEPLTMTGPSRIEPLADWLARLDLATVVVGPGLGSPRIRAAIPEGVAALDGSFSPDAEELVALVRRAWAAGRRDDLWTLEPNYLRRSAAEDQWDARSRT